jgi:xanthine/uracil/vitamin C permease (AzgA family)
MIDALLRDLRQPEYLHVLLNPLPLYGLAIGVLGLLVAICLGSRGGQAALLMVMVVCSAMAWPVFELGELSSDRIVALTDEDGRAWLEAHEHRAEQFLPFFYAVAIVSLVALLVPIKFPRTSLLLSVVAFLFGAVVVGMAGYIGYAGGKIRHPEFRTGPPPEAADRQNATSD